MEDKLGIRHLHNPDKVLYIDNPEDYVCGLITYTNTHGLLLVEVTKISNQGERFYLLFQHVTYFSGFFSWKGANLYMASNEAYLRFMKNMEAVQNLPDEELLNPYRFGKLFVFDGEKKPIHILALHVAFSDRPTLGT